MARMDQNRFYEKLVSNLTRMSVYENELLKDKARQTMNVERLKARTRDKLDSFGLDNSHFKDLFLVEIMDWFKNDFFTWTDMPVCHKCGGSTERSDPVSPTPAELKYGGSRVENYRCNKCLTYTRFPRYNDPEKLLETRTGRCGEWANCFVLCCRAVDFETRYVLDFTDHVWAEVYSDKQKRWIHCDPCENMCDKPLLYESGWGKHLSYVMAFSYDNIQDVSWRYSGNHVELLQRRSNIDEKWIVQVICNLRLERFNKLSLSSSERQRILEKTAIELVELMIPNNSGGKDMPGRTTGSLAWRVARGELGSGQQIVSHIIKPTESELSNSCLHISYNCFEDIYIRSDGIKSETFRGWNTQLYDARDVFRKVENDWKQVYICRTEKSFLGTVTWKIDLLGTGKKLNTLQVFMGCQCFENGQVVLKILNNLGIERDIVPNEERRLDEFCNSETIFLTAVLSGGRGEHAWQHSQLFRQEFNSSFSPFQLELTFKD